MEKIKPKLKGHGYLATGNKGKLKEIIPLCQEYFDLEPLNVEGLAPDGAEESASSFEGNASIKSNYVLESLSSLQKQGDFWILSDDSGLCVDALGGNPGVRSARYAGDHVSSSEHMKKLIASLKNSESDPPFKAHYYCALSLIVSKNSKIKEYLASGQCFGEIVFEAQGDSGFGYDPIFYVPQFNRTFAQTTYEEKNSISHRRRAFEALQKMLLTIFLFFSFVNFSFTQNHEQRFSDYYNLVTKIEKRWIVPAIPYNISEISSEEIQQSPALKNLFNHYLKASGIKEASNLRWQAESLGQENVLPHSSVLKPYFNAHVIKLYQDQELLRLFRAIDTTTGCSSGCSPVIFHLSLNPQTKELHLIEDPQQPLQKTGHMSWSAQDLQKIQSVLKNIPAWFEKIPAPSSTTLETQTWPIYKDFLIAGSAYTSYRILETALQFLEHSNPKFKRTEALQKLNSLAGDIFRVTTLNEAKALFSKLQTKPQSYLEARFQSSLAALLVPWITLGDSKFSASEVLKHLNNPIFKHLPSAQCFIIEEIVLSPEGAQKLNKELSQKPQLIKAFHSACNGFSHDWLKFLASQKPSSEFIRSLQTSATIPQFLLNRPTVLMERINAFSNTSDQDLRIQLSSILKAHFPRLELSNDQINNETVKNIEDSLRSRYLTQLTPNLGKLPSTQLNKAKGSLKIPLKNKQVYLFFASWCEHCKKLLALLNNEIKDPKLWDKIVLIESFSHSGSLTPAINLCKSVGISHKTCDQIVLLPKDSTLSSQIHLSSTPRTIVTDSEGKILDFDFIFEEHSGADPLRKLHWLLAHDSKQ